jgi:hypothetical protein
MAREAAQFVRRQFDIGHCTRALEAQYDHIVADAVPEQTVPSWNAR